MRIAVIGLGEVGSLYAEALVAGGHSVAGFDPGPAATPAGVVRAGSAAEAVAEAELVMVLTTGAVATRVARECAGRLAAGAVYADLTSASPEAMREVAEVIDTDVADAAILGSVPRFGVRTPLVVSGPGAPTVAALARELDAPIEVLDAPVGAATAHKLLRSVFMKGLAMIIIEALEAGRAAGCERWVRGQIARLLGPDADAVIDRLVAGSRDHAQRQAQEMASVAQYLGELGVPREMTEAARRALAALGPPA